MKYIPVSTEEEKLFAARIADLIRLSGRDGERKYSGFLDLRQKEIARFTAQKYGANFSFFGGFENAERTMLCVFPEWEEEDSSLFPITALDYAVFGEFCHRDVLGSVLALGLSREPVGDILVSDGGFRIYVAESAARFIKNELQRVGGSAVGLIEKSEADYEIRLMPQSDTVASLRLDCVVSAMTNSPRERAAELITHGMVTINHVSVTKLTTEPEAGDIVTVRGSGKFRIDDISGHSRKGRIILKYSKYV